MSHLFESGRIVDLILALVVLEVIGISAYYRATGRGVPPLDLLANLLAGVFLLLALRAALTAAPWTWIALSMVAALLAHVTDLWRRWRGKG